MSANSSIPGVGVNAWIRALQWPDGANHEGLAPLLRTNGDSVGNGAKPKMAGNVEWIGAIRNTIGKDVTK